MSNTNPSTNYCCKMREHFLVGIIGKQAGDPPIEHLDFMLGFDPPVIAIRYCPFCGSRIANNDTLRTRTRLDVTDDE